LKQKLLALADHIAPSPSGFFETGVFDFPIRISGGKFE
jgi:hypothetical protein